MNLAHQRMHPGALSRIQTAPAWTLATLAGRFVEITGGADTAALTVCAGLLAEVHAQGQWAAWVGGQSSCFFPPDLAAAGVDLRALPVVRVTGVEKMARAADKLVRSGAFAAVVIDLGEGGALPLPVQTRLVGLAKKHHAAIIVIARYDTRHGPGAAGAFASIRAETSKRGMSGDTFHCEVRVVKDKRGTPGWRHGTLACRP
ncbi:MAG: hypothetical protein AMXMBFR84_32720 [Candidatus Hydrogenedentota bacterium]